MLQNEKAFQKQLGVNVGCVLLCADAFDAKLCSASMMSISTSACLQNAVILMAASALAIQVPEQEAWSEKGTRKGWTEVLEECRSRFQDPKRGNRRSALRNKLCALIHCLGLGRHVVQLARYLSHSKAADVLSRHQVQSTAGQGLSA